MEKEEGEMSDDNAMQIDDAECDTVKEPETDKKLTMLYKADKSGILIEQLEKIDAFKLEERAKRFGLNLTGTRSVTQAQIDELYAKSGIGGDTERHFRCDALHLKGISGLTTKEIFEYLEDYKPVSLEWVDDTSCNIVCQDHISAALALLVHSREIKNEDLKKMLNDKSRHHWREGMPHPKKDLILMRFATNGDKKVNRKRPERKNSGEYLDESMDMVNKNPWGDLCKSWGIYDHQEVFQRKLPKVDYEDEIEVPSEIIQIKNKRLAMRLGKRNHKIEESDSDESGSDSEWKRKSKTPRMRMHADDEERKKKQGLELSREIEASGDADKDTYAPLSIEVTNSRINYTPRETTILSDKFKSHTRSSILQSKTEGIQSRLGIKVAQTNEESSDGGSSDSSDHNIMSRVQKVSNAARNGANASVWSRLENKTSKDNVQSDLRQILKSRTLKISDERPKTKHDDLRERISKSKKSNLRIEIDNN